MNGKLMVGGIVAIALSAGVGLWYSQTYAYYERVTGVEEVFAYGDAFPVSEYRGIDADTSPLKMRACFTVGWDYAPSDTYKAEAEPLNAPGWFDCFNAEQLAKDIEADIAVVMLAEKNVPFGFSRYIAQYEDGRAYMWRQINACGHAQFDGDDLPAGCKPEEGVKTASLEIEVEDKPVVKVPGVATGGIGPVDVVISLTPVNGGVPEEILQDGVEATSDNAVPESLWACFNTPLSMGLLTESYEVVEDIAPESPVSSLPCFDADAVKQAVTQGDAVAFLGERDVWPGVDRLVAVYQDGRAVAWNQRRAN